MTDDDAIATKILALREARKWSQAQLAGLVSIAINKKIPHQTIQQIETRKIKSPRYQVLIGLAKVFDLRVEDLVMREIDQLVRMSNAPKRLSTDERGELETWRSLVQWVQAGSFVTIPDVASVHASPSVQRVIRTLRDNQERVQSLLAEVRTLKQLANTTEGSTFDQGVLQAASHQVPADTSRLQDPTDWYWRVGQLTGQALQALLSEDRDSAKQHLIETAAVLRAWHTHLHDPSKATSRARRNSPAGGER